MHFKKNSPLRIEFDFTMYHISFFPLFSPKCWVASNNLGHSYHSTRIRVIAVTSEKALPSCFRSSNKNKCPSTLPPVTGRVIVLSPGKTFHICHFKLFKMKIKIKKAKILQSSLKRVLYKNVVKWRVLWVFK